MKNNEVNYEAMMNSMEKTARDMRDSMRQLALELKPAILEMNRTIAQISRDRDVLGADNYISKLKDAAQVRPEDLNPNIGKAYYYIEGDKIREAYNFGKLEDKLRSDYDNYYNSYSEAEKALTQQQKEKQWQHELEKEATRQIQREEATVMEWYKAGLEDMQHIFKRIKTLRAEGHTEEIRNVFDGHTLPEFRLTPLKIIEDIVSNLHREQIREWFPNLHSPEQVNEEIEKQLK